VWRRPRSISDLHRGLQRFGEAAHASGTSTDKVRRALAQLKLVASRSRTTTNQRTTVNHLASYRDQALTVVEPDQPAPWRQSKWYVMWRRFRRRWLVRGRGRRWAECFYCRRRHLRRHMTRENAAAYDHTNWQIWHCEACRGNGRRAVQS
jgi:hypothetical protein